MLMGLETHNVREPLPLRAVTGRKTGVGGSQSPSCISSSASQRLTPSCRKESPFTYGLVGMQCPLPLWMLTWRGLARLSGVAHFWHRPTREWPVTWGKPLGPLLRM